MRDELIVQRVYYCDYEDELYIIETNTKKIDLKIELPWFTEDRPCIAIYIGEL